MGAIEKIYTKVTTQLTGMIFSTSTSIFAGPNWAYFPSLTNVKFFFQTNQKIAFSFVNSYCVMANKGLVWDLFSSSQDFKVTELLGKKSSLNNGSQKSYLTTL